MARNSLNKPVIQNGPTRPGQYEWHGEACEMEDWGIDKGTPPTRDLWCITHGQWAKESPVSVTYTFKDGTTIVRERKA